MKKRTALWLSFALFLCLAIPTTGRGALFSYQSGNFTIAGTASVIYGGNPNSQTFGPISGLNVQGAAHAVGSEPPNHTDAGVFASGNSDGDGQDLLFVQLAISGAGPFGYILKGNNNVPPVPPFSASAGATVSTGTGIFYRVIPETGENYGDQGTLYLGNAFDGMAYAQYGKLPAGWANVKLGPTTVTVNNTTIYSRPEYQGYSFGQGWPYQPEAFPIKIGDIIRITMGGEVSATDANVDVGIYAGINNNVELFLGEEFIPSPAPLPSSFLIFGSGLLGLVGFRLRKF